MFPKQGTNPRPPSRTAEEKRAYNEEVWIACARRAFLDDEIDIERFEAELDRIILHGEPVSMEFYVGGLPPPGQAATRC